MMVFGSLVQAQTVNKMTVNVKVRSGSTIEMNQFLKIQYSGFNSSHSLFSSEGTLSFMTTPNTEVFIVPNTSVNLVNEFGDLIHVESTSKKDSDLLNGSHLVSINASVDCAKTPRGLYQGNLRTVIEYL